MNVHHSWNWSIFNFVIKVSIRIFGQEMKKYLIWKTIIFELPSETDDVYEEHRKMGSDTVKKFWWFLKDWILIHFISEICILLR